MSLRMSSLKRDPKSGAWVARKGIPADVQDAYARLYGARWEAKLRYKGTAADARRAYTDWLAEVEARIAALRDAAGGKGRSLTRREAYELAVRWHGWFVAWHENTRDRPSNWQLIMELLRDAHEESFVDDDSVPGEEDYEPKGISVLVRKYEALLTQFAALTPFLDEQGISLTQDGMSVLVVAVQREFASAVQSVMKVADGDFSPLVQRTPLPESLTSPVHSGPSCWSLFEAWIEERKPAAGTVERWRVVFLDLQRTFGERAAASITAEDAANWANGLTNSDRSGKTVNEIWIRSASTVFAWAKGKRLLGENPFTGIKVGEARKAKLREHGPSFTDDEIKIILKGTLQEAPERLSRHHRAARRWVPWLCAYTGSRPGEMTQLRAEDVQQLPSGLWVARITPEAGSVKTMQARTVPLHAHLIEQGFPGFVQSLTGPLFFDPDNGRVAREDAMNPKRTPAEKVRERLGNWVRSLGVADPEIRPNHAWRHTFKRRAARSGIEERLCDAFCGHAPASVGRLYLTPSVVDLADALKRFPRYDL